MHKPTPFQRPLRPALMGILNITPDSFSGDGLLGADAVAAAEAMAQAGVQYIDVGAESTRPNAPALDSEAECARLLPVLQALAQQPWRARLRISVDTRHARTAALALALGMDTINDVSGLADPAMLEVLRSSSCEVVVMHALSAPVDPQLNLPPDADALQVVLDWKASTVARVQAAGIEPARLLLDPGIGFGKTALQSLALMQGAGVLVASGGRWLVGHSRKSFLKLFTAAEAGARDDLTLAYSASLAHAGVQVVRVHAVQRHVALFDALFG
jgi:dihydropteroate synthase